MDIHKPKPVHNLREFLSEIAVIVIGVAIALTGEQVVEWLHWQHQVAEADKSLGEELSETAGQGDERVLVSDCVDRRLDLLGQIVQQAASRGRLPPLGDIGSPPVRTWSTGAWQSSLSAQAIAHMPIARRDVFAVAFGYVAALEQTNPRELDTWTGLYAMVGPGRALGPEEAAHLLTLVSQARTSNQIMASYAVRVQQLATTYGFPINQSIRQSFVRPKPSYSVCMPIGVVPDRYGGSPIASALDVVRSSPAHDNEGFAPITTRAAPVSATKPLPRAAPPR